jgi:protein FRA10AC1
LAFTIVLKYIFFLGLCPDCSYKLNYHHKKKEVTRRKLKKPKKAKKKKRKREERSESAESDEKSSEGEQFKEEAKPSTSTETAEPSGADIWREAQQVVEEISRDAEFEEYLQDLFL